LDSTRFVWMTLIRFLISANVCIFWGIILKQTLKMLNIELTHLPVVAKDLFNEKHRFYTGKTSF